MVICEPTADSLLHQPCSCPQNPGDCVPTGMKRSPIHTPQGIHTHIHTTHPPRANNTPRPLHTPLYITQTLHVNGWEKAPEEPWAGAGEGACDEWSREGHQCKPRVLHHLD